MVVSVLNCVHVLGLTVHLLLSVKALTHRT